MREIVILSAILLVFLVLQALLAASVQKAGLDFLVSLIYAIPFVLMGWVNLRDARRVENLTRLGRASYWARGLAFILAAGPIFVRDSLPYFLVYTIGIFLLGNIAGGILEHKAQE